MTAPIIIIPCSHSKVPLDNSVGLQYTILNHILRFTEELSMVLEATDLNYTFIISAEEARNGATLPFIGVEGMSVQVPAGASDGQRVPLVGKDRQYTVKVQICQAKYCLYQRIFDAKLHDSLLIRHRDKKFLSLGLTLLIALVTLFGACTIGLELMVIGVPLMATTLLLPNLWVKVKANRARAKVELQDRMLERQQLFEA